MSGRPKGPDRGCGCESGVESEPECDPCRGSCKGWQRYFPRVVPGPYLNPSDLQTLRKSRVVVVSAMGSFILAGLAYQRYLHYKATRDMANKKKKATKVKPSTVSHEHLKTMPRSSLVSRVKKELVNVEVKEEAEPDVWRTTGASDELNKSEPLTPSGVNNEILKVDVLTKDEEDMKNEHEIIEESNCTPLGVQNVKPFIPPTTTETENKSEPVGKRQEPIKSGRLGNVRSKINPSRIKKELPNVGLKKKIGGIENAKEPQRTLSGEDRPKTVSSPVIKNEKSNLKAMSSADISHSNDFKPHSKKDLSETANSPEIKKESTNIGTNNKVDLVMNTPKVKRLKIAPNPYLKVDAGKGMRKAESMANVRQMGESKDEEKLKTENTKLITVVTEGKKGSHVKRRGWK